MGRIILLVIVGIAAGLAIPTTRPKLLEQAAPVLYPFYRWQTTGEMEEIAREISSYERTYYKLPTSRQEFPKWLDRTFIPETATDIWGTTYDLRTWPDSFAISSAGPDLTMDTEDDIRHLMLRMTALRERSQGR